MRSSNSGFHIVAFLFTARLGPAVVQATYSSTPKLRVEGPTSTIFEGPVTSSPHNITVSKSEAEYKNFYCDGVHNNQPNPSPFNTALSALDVASKKSPKFTYDGYFNTYFEDFYIDQIAGIHEDPSPPSENPRGWGLIYNFKAPQVGNGAYLSGCGQEVHNGDDVLYAFNYALSMEHGVYLKLTPSGTTTVAKGATATFTVVDGMSGAAQPSATFKPGGAKADSKGKITLKATSTGTFTYKAEKTGAIRSNRAIVVVK